MAAIANQGTATNPDDLYARFEGYPFESDPTFANGLPSITAPLQGKPDAEIQDKINRAKAFYFSRFSGEEVNWDAYLAWKKRGSAAPPSISVTTTPGGGAGGRPGLTKTNSGSPIAIIPTSTGLNASARVTETAGDSPSSPIRSYIPGVPGAPLSPIGGGGAGGGAGAPSLSIATGGGPKGGSGNSPSSARSQQSPIAIIPTSAGLNASARVTETSGDSPSSPIRSYIPGVAGAPLSPLGGGGGAGGAEVKGRAPQ